jgi:ribosomal protein S27E
VQKDIKCGACGTLFGKETNGTLTIKHRDLYRHIKGEGAVVQGPCRGCGNEVTWTSTAGK